MKQELKKVKTSYYEVNTLKYPAEHIREYLEFDSNSEAFDYREKHEGYYLSGWTKKGTFKIYKDYMQEYTFENKAIIRLNYCKENKVYTICACCGAELHENQKENHTLTKYGYIGPECIKHVLAAGIEI